MKRALLAVVVLALIAVGCGDDGPESSEGAPSSTSAAASPTATTATTATTAAPTTTTTTSAPAAGCDHQYFPVRPGASWTYQPIDGDEATWEITSVAPDGRSAVMEADLVGPDGIINAAVNMVCDEDGISAPELAFTGLPFGTEVTQISEDGVFLPPAAELVEGGTWTSVVTITAELQGGITFEIVRTAEFTVIGEETLTVPAGTFATVRVLSEYTLDIDAGGQVIATEGADDLWFGEGVGLVKEAEATEGDTPPSFGTELVEFVLP